MSTRYRIVLMLLTGVLTLGLWTGQSVAANKSTTPPPEETAISRDGTALLKKERITQAERQAAAKRAKEKGFVAQKVGDSAEPAATTESEKGVKK